MRMPSAKLRKSLDKAVRKYQEALHVAGFFLTSRGISPDMAELWRLGVVHEPDPGHEPHMGRLCIPYVNRLGVVAVKFRCLQDHDCKGESCPKYTYPVGQQTHPYNVLATEDDGDTIHICEGELDTIVLSSVLGEPAVGIPGVQNWKPHYPYLFKGFDRVLVWADGDKAGQDFAAKLRNELVGVETVPMPRGHDVNSLFLEVGADGIRKLAGEEEE